MKVLFCTSKFNVVDHGPAKFAQLVSEMADYENSIDLRILTEEKVDTSNNWLFQLNPYKGPFGFFGMLLKPWRYYRTARILRDKFSFDVIVFNHGMVSIVSSIFLDNKVKVVAMVNDDNSSSLSLFKPGFNRRWVRYYIFRIIERLAVKYSDLIIVNSDYLKNELIRAYKLKPGKIVKLYKGIDMENIVPSNRELNSSGIINILFVKSDFKRGGLEILLKSLGILKEYEFRLTIIGPQVLPKLNYLDNLKLDFRGKQSQQEIYKLLSEDTDIFCVPSLREGLGVANIEAMIHGVPIVSTDVGGIPEVTSNGEFGWLATPNDPVDLSEKLRMCIENKKERKMNTSDGKQFVEKNFSKQIVLKNFNKILQDINAGQKKT